MPTTPPGWLIPSFVRSCEKSGATAGRDAIEAEAADLIERWQGPGRAYHNLRHLVTVLARVDELAEETHQPELVRLAVWYHNASLKAHGKVDVVSAECEVDSALMALQRLEGLGVPAAKAERVHDLVASLVRHDPPEDDLDAAALSDADLGLLATDPQEYADYVAKVRAEYSHVPDLEFYQARSAFLTKLLSRRRLFHSPMGQAWEGAARDNLEAESQRLGKKIAKLEELADAPVEN